ncbi:MAG TPA: glycoside hydrolase family 18 protein [Candidatus Sulfotelmatobacter sp.]
MKTQNVVRIGAACSPRFSLLIVAVAVLFSSVAWAQDSAPVLQKRLVADYGYWSKYQTPPYGAAQIPIHKMTHVLHAGINIDAAANGTIDVPDGFVERELISKAHNAGVKVFILFGGSASAFSTVAANEDLRFLLAANLWDFAAKYGYDGVDIDWEYPVASDAKGYYELMSALRAFFPSPTYQLSADVPPWGGSGYNLKHVVPVVDFLNIMTYDCAGPWTDDAQLNSPIFWDGHDPEPYECQPGGSVQEAINAFLKVAPAAKINMGTPFYGYDYRNVSQLWGSCTDCNSSVVSENYGTFIKQRVNQDGWVRYYDSIAGVPYLLRANGKPGFITYDDPSSTYLRVWYTDWERGLGGTFLWSLDADYDGMSQDLLDAMYNATLNTPGATQ